MADLYKVLHHLDVVVCSNGGFAELFTTVVERRTEVESTLRVLTDDDLYHHVKIYRCSLACSTIVSIEAGLARQLEVKGGAIPILGNLSATSNKGCKVTWSTKLADQLALEEKREKSMYVDSTGNPSVGIGFNMNKTTAQKQLEALGLNFKSVYTGKTALTDPQIDSLFQDDTDTAQATAKGEIPGFDSLSDARQNALTDATFNMGSFTKFPSFVRQMNAGNYSKAADELGLSTDGKSPSLWLTQTGQRAQRIIAQIRGDEVYGTPA
jgi:GH24 family phage-related lysozyme (muramidase)